MKPCFLVELGGGLAPPLTTPLHQESLGTRLGGGLHVLGGRGHHCIYTSAVFHSNVCPVKDTMEVTTEQEQAKCTKTK